MNTHIAECTSFTKHHQTHTLNTNHMLASAHALPVQTSTTTPAARDAHRHMCAHTPPGTCCPTRFPRAHAVSLRASLLLEACTPLASPMLMVDLPSTWGHVPSCPGPPCWQCQRPGLGDALKESWGSPAPWCGCCGRDHPSLR